MRDTENRKRAKYEPSTKGGTLLKYEAGLIYHFATRYGANEHWYCKERKNALVKCKAFAAVKEERYCVKGAHNHGTSRYKAKEVEKGSFLMHPKIQISALEQP